MEKVWEDNHKYKTNKIRFEQTQTNREKCRSEVTPDSGRYSIEYYLSLMKLQFDTARKEQNWTGAEIYDHSTQCLTGDIKTSWEETLESDYPQESQRTHPTWDTAQDKFMSCSVSWKPE